MLFGLSVDRVARVKALSLEPSVLRGRHLSKGTAETHAMAQGGAREQYRIGNILNLPSAVRRKAKARRILGTQHA